MRLERLHLYYLVRILRIVLPLLILALASIFVWNYRDRPVSESFGEDGIRLGERMTDETEGLRAVLGANCVEVDADRSLGFEGGIIRFETVNEIRVGGCGDTPERRIRGAGECGVRRQAPVEIQCEGIEGKVEIELESQTTVRTQKLVYQAASDMLSSPAPVEIVRPGAFELRAAEMSVRLGERLFHLKRDVRLVRADGTHIEADEVWFDDSGNRVRAEGNLRLTSGKMHLSGGRGQLWLAPETYAPLRVEIRDDVTAVSIDTAVSPNASPSSREAASLQARELDLDFGNPEAIGLAARGDVTLEDGTRNLTGDVVSAILAKTGEPRSFEASGNARMMLDSGETIRSEMIRQPADDTLVTGENSVLDAGGARVVGRRFTIRNGNGIRFATDDFATITLPSGTFEGDSTEASFSGAGNLELLEQEGAVRVALEDRHGSADRLSTDGERIELTGSARIESLDSVLEGQRILMSRLDDSLEASGHVFLSFAGPTGPAYVEAERLERGQDGTLHVSDKTVLRQGNREVRAARMDLDAEGRGLKAEGEVFSIMEGIIVRSGLLDFDDAAGRIEYSGDVHAETDELTVDSGWLEVRLVDGGPDRIEAVGGVRVTTPEGTEGVGASATYHRQGRTITLLGPGAEADDPELGHCRGDEIVVNIDTHDARVRGADGRPGSCTPLLPPTTSEDR